MLLLIGSCQQPTSDPDQAVRDLIVAHHWISDPAYAPPPEDQVLFSVDGTFIMKAGTLHGRWTYVGGVFTISYYDNADPTSGNLVTEISSGAAFAVTKTTLLFNYLFLPAHFIPL